MGGRERVGRKLTGGSRGDREGGREGWREVEGKGGRKVGKVGVEGIGREVR